jgi:hypothetical protein
VRKRSKNSLPCKSHQRVWDKKILKDLLPKALNEDGDAGLYKELAYCHHVEAGLVGILGLIRDLRMTEQLVAEPALEGDIPKHNSVRTRSRRSTTRIPISRWRMPRRQLR